MLVVIFAETRQMVLRSGDADWAKIWKTFENKAKMPVSERRCVNHSVTVTD
jgi:hypothetical protein